MSILDVKDFTFTYKNGKTVLHHLSLSLEKGQMLLLCGKNGCGKSTLLRCIKQDVAPKGTTDGTITVNGGCQILFQDCDKNVIFRSAYEDLIFPACNAGMPEEEIRRKADDILTLFGIAHLKHRDTSTLSGGEKQLLSLASVFILEPDLLLLDEPLSQLDEDAKKIFTEKLLLIKNSGTAVVIAEHHTDMLLENSEKVLIFDNGGNTLYTKENLCSSNAFPNFPEYIALEHKLGLQPRSFTKQEAVNGLRAIKEQIHSAPLPLLSHAGHTLIVCRDIAFSYESTPVLKNLSFTLQEGEIAFICGKNGAGKSTFIHLICSFLKPEAGTVQIENGYTLGYLAQNPVYSFLKDTLLEDYRYVLQKNKCDETRMEQMFALYPVFADLKELLAQNPLDLSGGERAKAALFKLILIGKRIMLLDEPEKHLDKNSIEELSCILKDLAQKGFSFIIVSHSPNFIYNTAHSVSLLENGKITKYERDAYFPRFAETSLYNVVKAVPLEVFDVKEAEVREDG